MFTLVSYSRTGGAGGESGEISKFITKLVKARCRVVQAKRLLLMCLLRSYQEWKSKDLMNFQVKS